MRVKELVQGVTAVPSGVARVMALFAGMLLLAGTVAGAADRAALDDLLFDLQLVPLDGQKPAALSLERLGDGKRMTLAELRGRPVLLYFWASW